MSHTSSLCPYTFHWPPRSLRPGFNGFSTDLQLNASLTFFQVNQLFFNSLGPYTHQTVFVTKETCDDIPLSVNVKDSCWLNPGVQWFSWVNWGLIYWCNDFHINVYKNGKLVTARGKAERMKDREWITGHKIKWQGKEPPTVHLRVGCPMDYTTHFACKKIFRFNQVKKHTVVGHCDNYWAFLLNSTLAPKCPFLCRCTCLNHKL